MVKKATNAEKPHIIQVRVPADTFKRVEVYLEERGNLPFNRLINMWISEYILGKTERTAIKAAQEPLPLPVPALDVSLDDHYTYLYSLAGSLAAMNTYRASLPKATREALYDLECKRAPITQ